MTGLKKSRATLLIKRKSKTNKTRSVQSFSTFGFDPRTKTSYCWFSHDVTKIQTKNLSILSRFYFHDALEQLKTNFHTIERFWFLFWSILNGVTLKPSNYPITVQIWSHVKRSLLLWNFLMTVVRTRTIKKIRNEKKLLTLSILPGINRL